MPDIDNNTPIHKNKSGAAQSTCDAVAYHFYTSKKINWTWAVPRLRDMSDAQLDALAHSISYRKGPNWEERVAQIARMRP
jgi:hypothetical protein